MLVTDLIIGFLIFLCLRVASRLIKVIPSNKPYSRTLQYLFPAVEFLVWTAFLFWVLFHFFRNQFYYQALITSLVLILVALLSWFVVKDFIAGLIFKAENTFKENHVIKISDTEGTIKRLGYLSLDLINANGELEKVRYSSLSAKRVVKPNPSEALKKFEFSISWPAQLSEFKTIQVIRRHILNAPWSATGKDPVILAAGYTEENYQFAISIYALNGAHADAIEEYLYKQITKSSLPSN